MPTLQEILQDQNYINANPATKNAIFDRWAALDTNYTGANPATQQAIRNRYGVGGISVQEEPQPAPAKDRTVGEAFKDVGAGLVSGAGSLVQLPGQLYGLATGNFSKTGALGLGEDIAKYGEEMKSAGLKAREAERAAKVKEAEKEGQFAAFKSGFGETITDPALFTSFIAEQVPNILPMILTGGATAALTAGRASAAALAKGATKEAAAAAGKSAGAKAGTTAAVQTGAVMQGADIGAGSYDEIYGELRAKGMSEEQAAAETINKARAAGLTGYGLSVLANRFLPGGKALEEILAGKKITGSRIGSGAVTALKEIPSENIEEVGGRIAQNVAARQAGLDRELLAGTGETAALATLGAAGIGGAAGALAPRRSESEQAAKEVDAFKQEEAEFRKQFGETKPVEVKEPELPTEFPGGYTATRREVSRQDVPESYGIFAKGSDSPLTTVSTQEEADKKLQTLTEIRQQEQERLMAEGDNLMKPIEKARRELEVMEATGRANTDEYVQARALLTQREQEADDRFAEIFASINNYAQPLTLAPVGSRTDVQNDYVVKRGDEEIGAFPTLQDAELKLREIEPETFKQAEETARVETDDRVTQLKNTLTPMLAKFGLQDVGLNVVDRIENNAGGSYLDSLINISLTESEPIKTMRHEALHALKDLQFFTPQQYKALEERANKQWIKEYLQDQMSDIEVDGKVQTMSRLDAYKRLGYTQEAIVEEAIADAFGAYARGATPPPGMIAALFKKLQNFFLNFGQALRGAGFESADDVFQRVERGELKSRKPKAEAKAEPSEPKPEAKEKFSLPPQEEEKPTEGRTYKLDIEREKRKMAKSAFLTDEEMAAVNADAQKLNLSEAKIEQIIKTIKADKKRYPATQGWADLKVTGIESKTDDEGNPVPDSGVPKYAAISYGYNIPPGSKTSNKIDPVWLKKVTGKFQLLIENIYKRAAEGDVNAENIIGHQTWYKNVAATLRQEYGGFGDTLADLLGATSPNTPVDTNWRFSIDVMRRFVRGDFDAEMKKFVEYLDTGKSVSKYPSSDKIRQISGKLYGMNSTNAMLALADTWRAIKPDQAPKARNFALNLIGQSNMATIDVWAARMLRRAANMVPGASFDRIPPPAEKGVSGTWNSDATKVTGAFGFGAEVMQKVSDNLAKKGIIVAPPDLQAIAWFAEKELWGRKNWTTKAGEGGSFEENIEAQPTERFIAGHSVQIGSNKPLQKTVLDAQKRIEAVLDGDKGVLAYRVMQTSGLYGNEVEASFDTEIVADKGQFDPEDLIKELASISKKNKQWDIFVSRVVGVNEDSPNARPGVEIYFKTPQDMAKIMPVLDRFTSDGQDGFTLSVDPRADDGTNQYIGVRLQYVPEISMRWDEDLRQKLLAPGGLEQVLQEKADLLEEITADVAKMDGIAYASVASYDTVVIGKENYDDYIGGRVTEEDQTAGSQPWFGQPVRSHVERAVTRLQGYQGQVGEGGVSDIGEEPSAGKKLSLRTSFPSAKEAEDAAYDKAAPSTKEFKLFFGGSTIMDEGRPQPMYHGSASGFDAFSESKPIFISPDPNFAEQFAEDRAKDEGKSTDEMRVYPLWVRAETPFDYENKDHAEMVAQKIITDQKLSGPDSAVRLKKSTPKASTFKKEIAGGLWSTIEDPVVQDALKSFGFDSFYVQEYGNKNLAVFKAEQVKSITGNIGDFSLESKDMRFSLKKFNKEDLPQKGRDYILPQDTLLYHGAYKERADRIDEMGGVLLSRPPMRVSGGTIDEGGLIFFGDEDTARKFAENRADPMAVEGARQAGVERLTGKVFETATDRPYKLINRKYKMNAKEAKALTEALGLPDYKALDAGDPLEIATRRALDYGRSTIDRYEVTTRTGQRKETISAPWPVIFRTLGVDGFYDSLGVALTSTNGIRLIGKDGKLEKFSLPTIPQNLQDRMGETTKPRERKTVIQNIIDAITPTSAADFRAKYLNRYNQMSVYDKKRAEQMGGAALLADQSAESAALMSDLGAGVAASAMGFDDRNGGIPVLRNGITTIDKSVKGLIASLAPLAAQGDPAVYQRYQYWAMVKRGQRLNKEGKPTGIDSADVAFAKILEQKHPEFVSVQKDLIAFNNGLVQYMVDTGVLSKERGQIYTKYADYIPFYRQMDGDKTPGPNLFQSLSGVKPPKKLKGAIAEEAPLADFLETMVRNTQSSIQAGIKNYAAQRALNVAVQVQAPGMGAVRLNTKEDGHDIINVLEKGNLVSYRTPDPLLVNAMMSLNQSELPFMGFLSAPADLLRTLVTKEPGFMMANMMRDSLSAWVTSGQKMTPIAGTVINFGKALARKSPGFEAMLDAGIIGGYEFSENIEKSGFKLEDDLAKKAGKKAPLALRPFKSVWDALGKGTTASDAATRALIYERVLADTGNEAEALYRSLEVMNFHRKGSSPLIRVLTAAIPFFNARLQGLDLFYRASTGNMNNKDAASIQRQFFMRGMTMMALSGLYWMLVSDDEEYKKQEQETKDNNWIIPSLGVKIPIPFEVGVLFKVIPERIMAYSFGNDTGEDLQKSMIRSAVNTFAFNPIPQTIKPVLEAYVDYNMFTMRPILGQGMKDIEPEYQVGPSTSNFATVLAQSLGLSPMKVDHIIKGYTGTIGMYAVDTVDMVLDQFGDSPKPTKRFEQLPVIKRFASDPEARGFVTQYYELKDAVDTTVRTMNLLERTGQYEEYAEYLVKNQGSLAFKDYVRDTEKTMKDLRDMRTSIRSSSMTGDEKRDALLEISRMESAITSGIQEIKKAIAEVQ
jgi:hypothetical protein